MSELLSLEPNVRARLGKFEALGDVFANFALKSTPLAVNRSLLKWSTGDYGLELMFRIPTPHEVLMQQKIGRRVVTVLTREEQLAKYVLGERDALSFTMHDLIHADHFYHDNECYQGQLGFYGFLDRRLCAGDFRELLEDDKFKYEFEYLISDMNAYAIHSLKCFKSALIHYHPGKEEFFKRWLELLHLDVAVRSAWEELNTSSYDPQTADAKLLTWLDDFRARV